MSSYSACCRPNRDVQRIERAFERHGENVVVWELTGNRGYVVSGSERKVIFKSVTAAVRACGASVVTSARQPAGVFSEGSER